MSLSDEEIQFKILRELDKLARESPHISIFSAELILKKMNIDSKKFLYNLRYLIDIGFVNTTQNKIVGIPRMIKITPKGILHLQEKDKEVLKVIQKSSKKIEKQQEIKKCLELYDELILHSDIREVSESLYKNGNYRNSVLDAFIMIETMVKNKSKHPMDNRGKELSGVSLMHNVFDSNEPLLTWRPLREQTDKDELEGYKYIFAGAMQGIRNPKAHRIFEQEPRRALQLLVLSNLLAELIDSSTYMSPNDTETRV